MTTPAAAKTPSIIVPLFRRTSATTPVLPVLPALTPKTAFAIYDRLGWVIGSAGRS